MESLLSLSKLYFPRKLVGTNAVRGASFENAQVLEASDETMGERKDPVLMLEFDRFLADYKQQTQQKRARRENTNSLSQLLQDIDVDD